MYRSARVRIESVHPLPSRADSRDLGTTPVEFRVRAQALRVVVPSEGAETVGRT
jgi:diacylglycerol kinase family enzyme